MRPPAAIKRDLRFVFYKSIKYSKKIIFKDYFLIFSLIYFISLLNLFSVGSARQICFHIGTFIIGTAVSAIIANINRSSIRHVSLYIHLITCVLLLSVSIIGTKINGAQRWLDLGVFTIQPSEFLKLSLIIIIAYFIDNRYSHKNKNTLFDIALPLTLTILPIILIIKQPDLGTAIICLLIIGSIFLFIGIEKYSLFSILVFLIISMSIGWTHLRPYQQQRIQSFISSNVDYLGKGWQANQSLIGFGSGGIFGKGYRRGEITQLGYLPENETDFALSSLAEEHGFIAVLSLLVLSLLLLLRLSMIARNSVDNYSAIISIGIVFWLFWQICINTAMVCNLLPIVGIQFPIISYGCSGLLALFIAFGYLANVERC